MCWNGIGGNYAAHLDSRLISAPMQLETVTGTEELHFRFWHWFSYSSLDAGYVQISVQDGTTGEWSVWENVSSAITSGINLWTLMDLDITAYAGQRVRIAFYHTAARDGFNRASESTGWYIDDIELVKKDPVFTGDFETGWADWRADIANGVWEIGTPTAGPGSAHSGDQCAGTVLGGNYAALLDSRLISAPMQLETVTGTEELHFRFWHWFSYSSLDAGYVQISVQDGTTGEWSVWENVSSAITSGINLWTLMDLDITAYAGQRVRIAFYHTAARDGFNRASESTGWYVDDISITFINTTPILTPINNQVMEVNRTLNVPISAADLDGDPVTLSVTGLPGFGTFTDNGGGTGSIEFNPDSGDAGDYQITVTTSDGVLSDTESFTLTVTSINRAPILAAIGDQTVNEGDSLTVEISATDSDNDGLSFSASGLPGFVLLTDNNNGAASLSLTPGDGDGGSYDVTITVTDTGAPTLSDSEVFTIAVNVIAIDVSPFSIDFGDVFVGSSAYNSFTIDNAGTVTLEVTDIQSSDGSFSIFPPASFGIEPGGPVRTISIGFTPTAEEEFSGIISIISSAGDHVMINVTGRGVLASEPGDIDTRDSLEFGNVEEGNSVEQILTVTNTGSGPLTVNGASTDNTVFEVSTIPGVNLPFTLNPDESHNLTVRFSPPIGSAGPSYTGVLSIASDDPDEGTKSVALSGTSIDQVDPLVNNYVLGARVYFGPDDFDLINSSNCFDVGVRVQFSPEASSADSFTITLTDQGGGVVESASFIPSDGVGTAVFNGIDACGLDDGIIKVDIIYNKEGTELTPFSGNLAVKYTGTLEPPVLNPVPPVTFSSTIEVCGTSRANTTVRIEGGASVVSTILDENTTEFCLTVPLKPNTQNTLIVSAIDDAAPAPKPVAFAQPVQVVQVDLSEIVIVSASSRPLTQEEAEYLVDNGIIDLDDPSNFNVSMFTVVFTIGSFPVPITITQPVVVSSTPGAVSYGSGGSGWFIGGSSGGIPLGGCITGCAQIVVITGEKGQTIPGVIIIDGRIKTLKEFFQVTLAIWNISGSFNLSEMTSTINLPAGLTPIATGLGSEVPDVNLEGAVDTVLIGEIGPGETGVGQFIIRGDGIGIHNINVDFEGFVTGGGLPEPIPVSGSAGTTVQVLGPPELEVLLRFPTDPSGPDVTFGDIFDFLVEITNVSDRPALYASLELFVGGGAVMVGADGNPVPESNEIRSFGHIQPGETVTAAFRLKSQLEGEIIACQAIAAENITLTIDIGPDDVPCNIVNTFPANFEPLPPDAAPVVIGVNPANGQTNIPITTSVFAVMTPRSDCIVADTWTNVVTDFIDPLDQSKGLQVISADLVKAGTFYLEELNNFGAPVRHIPVDLTVVDPPAGGTTIAVLRLGLDSPHPNSQFFLTPNTAYRATLLGGEDGVCSAASGVRMENDFTWTFTTGESISLPTTIALNLEGMSQSSAEAALADAGLSLGDILFQDSDTVPEGDVIGQNLEAGIELPVGSPVDLIVSTGPVLLSVPNLEGLPLDEALEVLNDAGLLQGNITPQCSNTAQASGVLSQNPSAGSKVPIGTEVDLTVPVTIPEGTVSLTLIPGVSNGSTLIFTADLTETGLTKLASITIVDDGTPFGGAPGIFSGFDLDAIFLDADGDLGTSNDQSFASSYTFTAGTTRSTSNPVLLPNATHPGPTFGSLDVNTIDFATATLDTFDAISVADVNVANGVLTLGDGGTLIANFVPEISVNGTLYLVLGEVGGQTGERLINACIAASDTPYDSDGDGVPDGLDECSDTPAGATIDANGCSDSQRDSDGDGVTDDMDQCPDTPAGAVVDTNGCSAGQRDSDGDGVMDDVDKCPDTQPGEAVDADGCSAGQRDSDEDGVTDYKDICPDTPAGAIVDVNGCELILVEVPDVVGLQQDIADETIEDVKLTTDFECVSSSTVPAGEVVSQEPVGGTIVPIGSTVLLRISSGLPDSNILFEGVSAGNFVNPVGPSGMVTTGVGTNNFTWGNPGSFGTGSSSLNFAGDTISTTPEEEFIIGTLTYFNGTIEGGTEAKTVDLKVDLNFTNPDGISQEFIYKLQLINTRNTGHPNESADMVLLPSLYPSTIITVDGIFYTLKLTFGDIILNDNGVSKTDRFFVHEGQSATAELRGVITSCVSSIELPELTPIEDLTVRPKDGKIDIVWSPVPDAISYNIYRKDGNETYELVKEGHVTDYSVYADFGLTNGVEYCYKVISVNAQGQKSTYSNEACATPTDGRRRRR